MRSLRTADNLTCLFIDIDFFKKVNDTYGHQTGDQALKHVADALKNQLRSNDIIARYGGEEFVVLLPTASELKGKEVAERMRKAVEALPVELPTGKGLYLTVSIGTSTFVVPQSGAYKELEGAVLVDIADKALYKAKNAGRNRVCGGGEVIAERLAGSTVSDAS